MGVHIPQEEDHYCGPAVVQMILARFGVEAEQSGIAAELETDHVVGTSADEITSFFARRGFVVSRANGARWEDIKMALPHGAVIVGYIEPEGEPHYALVSAVKKDAIVLNDPYHGKGFEVPKGEFIGCWKDDEEGQYGHRLLVVISADKKIEKTP